MNDIQQTAKDCNYYDYMSKYLKYPPLGPLPLPGHSTEYDSGCDLWDTIFGAALVINPAFNVYRIFDVVFINIKPFLKLVAHNVSDSILFCGMFWASRDHLPTSKAHPFTSIERMSKQPFTLHRTRHGQNARM